METQSLPQPRDGADDLPDAGRLLERARGNDRKAFRALVVRSQSRIFSAALRLTGLRADAEELAQDVFIQLHAAIPRITDVEHLDRWLLRTVYHRSIDRLRQRERQGRTVPLDGIDGRQAHAPEATGDPMAASHLRNLLLQLEPGARAVLLLRFQDDLDPADIAAILDMPVNTVKRHLRRSLQWLRTRCAGELRGY